MEVMKLLLGLAVLALIALSLAADYRWRRWIKSREEARRQERQR